MASPAFSRQSFSPLLPIAYLGTLVGIGVLVWWLWPVSGASENTSSFVVAATADAYASPADFQRSKDVRLALLEQMTPEQSASRAIQGQLTSLQRYIRNLATNKPAVRPDWIGKSFVGVGIDPEKCSVKIDDAVTNVCRYTRTESAPKFAGNRAFQQFVVNTMSALANCDDFDVSIRLDKLTQVGDEFKITLLTESVGSRDPVKEERAKSNARKKAIQVSAVWQTTWASNGAKQYQLLTAEVPATEIVTLSLLDTRLFKDCTNSIIGKNRCLKGQLIYGVDQWAARVPGVNTQGNSGLSVGDVNDDGLDDIYLCQPQGIANRLFIQRKDGTAIEESQSYGVNLLDESRSSLLIDLDNDGDQDLVVATKSDLVFMSNSGDGHYEIIEKLDRCCNGLSLSAADYDNDGDLDLFLSRQPKSRATVQIADPATNLLAGSVLLRNDESFRFVDVTASVGLVGESPLPARAAIWFDRDLDGDQDLYVTAGESGGIQFVNTDGFFHRAPEFVASSLPAQQSASTGDFNADGRFDLFVASKSGTGDVASDESHISFGGQEDSSKPFFLRAPLFDDQYATSSLIADFNNDGRDDLMIGNGGFTRVALDDMSLLFPHSTDDGSDKNQELSAGSTNDAFFDAARLRHYSIHSRQRTRCYASIGAGGFAEVSSVSGFNSGYPDDSRALAATDWDQDGDVDVLLVNRTGPQLRFFINGLNRRNSISFKLTGKASNRDAIGARVEMWLAGVSAPLVKTIQAGGGFLSQSSKRLTFGIGEAQKVESVVVRWPSGKTHQFRQLVVGTTYELAEENAEPIVSSRSLIRSKRSSSLAGSLRQPAADKRTLFVPRFPLPSPEAQVAKGQWNCLKTSGEQPSVFLFWGQNPESTQMLQQLNRFACELEDANANVVTVFADSSNLRPDEQWKYLDNSTENSPEIRNWTSLSEGGLETMKIVFGHWFSKRGLPEQPFALLVDRDQNVVGLYPYGAFKKDQLLEDLELCDQPPTLADQNSNENGFWVSSTLPVDSRGLASRLREAGFDLASEQLLASVADEVAEDLKNEAKDFAALGRYDLAQQFYQAALQKSPDNIAALLGRSNLAIDHALATNRSESNATPDGNLALAVSDGGLTLPEAKAGFDRVLEIDPNEWRAAMGIAKIQLLQDRPSKALATLVEYQEVNPRVELLTMQGRVLFQSGSYAKALRVLNAAHDDRPDLPYLAGDLGYLYLLNDELGNAKKLLRKANRRQPSDLTFLRMLAEVEFLSGNFTQAVDLFTEVNRLEPDQVHTTWLIKTLPRWKFTPLVMPRLVNLIEPSDSSKWRSTKSTTNQLHKTTLSRS